MTTLELPTREEMRQAYERDMARQAPERFGAADELIVRAQEELCLAYQTGDLNEAEGALLRAVVYCKHALKAVRGDD